MNERICIANKHKQFIGPIFLFASVVFGVWKYAEAHPLQSRIDLNRRALQSFSRDARVALAGGIAGGVGTVILYPIDTAKTLRQTDPVKYPKIKDALLDLFFKSAQVNPRGPSESIAKGNFFHVSEAYRGVTSATLGAIPSSALYFGAYELAKRRIGQVALNWHARERIREGTAPTSPYAVSTAQLPSLTRIFVHSLAAASGNAMSSLVFVPKEYIKQQLQAYGSGRLNSLNKLRLPSIQLTAAQRAAYGIKLATASARGTSLSTSSTTAVACTTAGCVINETLRMHGLRGMYRGYQATLLRNIPTAVLRFAIYEEIKIRVLKTANPQEVDFVYATETGGLSPLFFLSGALAGAVASGIMTPLDVLKTRMATETLPANLGAIGGIKQIFAQHGLHGLYAGACARMFWSGTFSAIGFGTFEAAKYFLGVRENQTIPGTLSNKSKE